MKKMLCFVTAFLCLTAVVQAQTVLFYIDPSHSSVQFKVPFWGVTDLSGRFNRFFGTIEFDENNLANASAHVIIDVASIDTGIERRDNDLRQNYFHSDSLPAIEFMLSTIVKDGDGYLARGDLQMHGATKSVSMPARILGWTGKDSNEESDEMGIAIGPLTIDRTEFGITHGRFSGDRVFVGDEVTIDILLRLREPSAEKKQQIAELPQVALSEAELKIFTGSFSSADGEQQAIIKKLGDALAAEFAGWGVLYWLVPTGGNRFRVQDRLAVLEFNEFKSEIIYTRKGNDAITLLRLTEN